MTDIQLGGRRHDLDALRVLCFGTLIIYHTSLVYGTRDWLLNSYDSNPLVDLIAVASHPWRMSLLFFISGLVTRSLLRKKSISDIRSARTRQLLIPFVFGVFLVVPPQIYLAESNPFPDLSYWDFLKVYFASGPSLEHLWYLAYLWIYVFIWSHLWPRIERLWPNLSSGFAGWLQGRNLFLLPIIFLSILRVLLYPIFGETKVIATDLYSHLIYVSMFMAGSLLAGEPLFWREVDRRRWVASVLSLISLFALTTIILVYPQDSRPEAVVVMTRIVRSIFQWCAIIALLGLAGRYANHPSRTITFLNKSMMTYYVVHQTVIVIAAYHISKMGMLDIRSFIPVILITAASCALIAEGHKLLAVFVSAVTSRVATVIKPSAKLSASTVEWRDGGLPQDFASAGVEK